MGVLSIQLNKQRKPTGYLLQKMTGGEWEMYLHYQPAAQSSQHHEAPLDFSLSCGEPIDVLAGAVPLDAGLTEFEGGGDALPGHRSRHPRAYRVEAEAPQVGTCCWG